MNNIILPLGFILSCALCYAVYIESGPFTALAFAVLLGANATLVSALRTVHQILDILITGGVPNGD